MPTVDDHPLLVPEITLAEYPSSPLGEVPSPPWLTALLAPEVPDAPVARSEELRKAVRDLLRHGGYKPTGRGKPSCEYLVRAAGEGKLGTINAAVDVCNAVSLHSGLPISVVDLDRAVAPLRIGIAPEGSRYEFNASGQEIDVGGLLCVFDAEGPCGNAVKDAQRTKTTPETRRTLSVIWGVKGYEEHGAATAAWYRELLERTGASAQPYSAPE